MSNRQAATRGLKIGALIIGSSALAFIVGTAPTGCGGGSGSSGTGGGAAGTTGAAGTSGGSTGTAGNGTGGTGGSTVGCGNDFIEITGDITTDTTWPCNSYVLNQKTHIDGGSAGVVTLTIAAGSTIYGNGSPTSPAALISTRNGKLVAVGTATAPITFTSYVPVGQRAPGDTFAGVVLLGRATINNGTCVNGSGTCAPPGYFQRVVDGIPADDPRGQFGGTDDTWNCGDLRYVRIQFAGYILGTNNELNALTVGGCGSQTRLSYIQVHRGLDDGIEFFGGTASLDHVVIAGVDDDCLDWDAGWRGSVQFLIVHQAYGTGDKGFEADNYDMTETVTPRSAPTIWNATLIGQAANPNLKTGMHLRRGTWYKMHNLIVYGFGSSTPQGTPPTLGNGAINVEADPLMTGNDPVGDWPTKMSIETSLFFGGPLAPTEQPAGLEGGVCPNMGVTEPAVRNNDDCFNEPAALMDPARMNSTDVDPMFQSTIRDGVIASHPSYVPGNVAGVSGKATPPAPFDQTATYAGAVDPATPPGSAWYDGWTEFPEK